MEADIGVENGKMPPCSPTASDYVPVLYRPRYLPSQMAETAGNVNHQLFAVLGDGNTVPGPAVMWLGFVVVLLVVAVVLIAPGCISIAAVGLIFGVGLARSGGRRAAGLGP
jgi:hypothetical protein